MTQNNNLSVLPFYTDINQQNHRKSYAYGEIYPLFAPANILLPFQIMRSTRANEITKIILYDKNGIYIEDLTQDMKDIGLHIARFPNLGYDNIVFPAILPMPTNMFDGIYYLTISDGVQTWYSEMFTVVQDMKPYLKIEWWDKENFVFDAGQIVYQNPGFKNRLFFCAELGKPEYTFDEEAETRNGYVFPIKQISNKTYKFTILAPEYLCDAMRLIRMADIVKITDKYGREYYADTFLLTPKWQTQGDLASVEIEFTNNSVIKKNGLAYERKIIGDYNNDFNNDFNEEFNNDFNNDF